MEPTLNAPVTSERKLSAVEIAARIRDQLRRGELHPGDRLRELHLTAQFGVSRGRIREALSALEASGLVRIEPRRGATLTRFTDVEAVDAIEIGTRLMDFAVAKAAERATEDQRQAMLAAAEALVSGAEDGALGQHLGRIAKVIRLVAEATHNPQLQRLIEGVNLSGPATVYTPFGMRSPARRRQSAESWRKVVSAIAAGDAKAASAACRQTHAQALKAITQAIHG